MNKSLIFGLLSLALVLRLLFLLLAGVNAPLTGDELAYQQIAENVAAGRGFFQTNNPFFPGEALYAWQAPLYPLCLGLIYTALGANVLAAKAFGILVSTVTVYATYDLARNMFHDPRAALVSGALVAIYPGLLTNSHLLLSETLFTFLLVLAFDLAAHAVEAQGTRSALGWSIGAGITWGLATLTRGLTLYFTPLLSIWLAWVLAHRSPGHVQGDNPRGGDWRSGLAAGAALLVVAFATILPWSVRNYSVFHEWVLLETKGGVNFWLGNSPYTPPDFIRNVWKAGIREPMLAALPEGETARDRAGYALGLDYVRREPLTFLMRIPVKFADFWSFERNLMDVAAATAQGGGWSWIPKAAADLLGALVYILVIVGAIGGVVGSPPDRWHLLLLGFTVYFVLVHVVIFGDGRFHLPLIPLLTLYAGWFALNVRAIAWRGIRPALAAALGLTFVAVWVREIGAALGVLTHGL